MKSANSLVKWIFFVPVLIASVVAVLLDGLFPNMLQNSLSISKTGMSEIIAYAVLGLFVVCFLLSLLDRKTSPIHILHKNYYCAITSILCAFGLAASAALNITNTLKSTSADAMVLVVSIFAAISGVAMLFIGLNHLSGANARNNTSLLYLALPLWCGVHLIDRFLSHTATPVHAADTLDLVMFVALALFFVNAMMVHSFIPAKNSVKATMTFGFPAVVITLVYGIIDLFNVLGAEHVIYINIIPSVTYILIGLYVLGFVAELSFCSKTNEEQRVLEVSSDDEEDFEDTDDEYGDSYDTDSTGYSDVTDESSDSEDIEQEDTSPDITDSSEADFDSSADELIRAAQQSDSRRTQGTADEIFGSDDMIIEGEKEIIAPASGVKGSEPRPKGVTVREAVTYGDEDFIVEVSNIPAETERHEDISAFILTAEETPDNSDGKSDKFFDEHYVDRLDEIDKLIISIQGGEQGPKGDNQ